MDELRVEQVAEGTRLKVKAVPGASRDRLVGVLGDALKVAVTAAPEKGKANKRILQVLADALGTAARELAVVGGESSRDKWILVRSWTPDEVRARLTDVLASDRPDSAGH